MTNFLQETLMAIRGAGHTLEDIGFIGSRSGYSCTWDEFLVLADFEYDSGYGAQWVADDLVIRFSNGGWLRRDEYDGSENWTYVSPWNPPRNCKPIKTLMNGEMWASLEEMNR